MRLFQLKTAPVPPTPIRIDVLHDEIIVLMTKTVPICRNVVLVDVENSVLIQVCTTPKDVINSHESRLIYFYLAQATVKGYETEQ